MPGMNSRNKTKVIRDVSCTSSLDCDSELRGAEPNPLDFGCVMEKIRRKTFFFQSPPLTCYSRLVFLWVYCDVRKADFSFVEKKDEGTSWEQDFGNKQTNFNSKNRSLQYSAEGIIRSDYWTYNTQRYTAMKIQRAISLIWLISFDSDSCLHREAAQRIKHKPLFERQLMAH